MRAWIRLNLKSWAEEISWVLILSKWAQDQDHNIWRIAVSWVEARLDLPILSQGHWVSKPSCSVWKERKLWKSMSISQSRKAHSCRVVLQSFISIIDHRLAVIWLKDIQSLLISLLSKSVKIYPQKAMLFLFRKWRYYNLWWETDYEMHVNIYN